MSRRKIYKHALESNLNGLRDKIKAFRKSNTNKNKRRR